MYQDSSLVFDFGDLSVDLKIAWFRSYNSVPFMLLHHSSVYLACRLVPVDNPSLLVSSNSKTLVILSLSLIDPQKWRQFKTEMIMSTTDLRCISSQLYVQCLSERGDRIAVLVLILKR
ncbi:hypothetical protein L6452_20467 [Arctium lappa]|uniref:Uncharacterized protein n=1 Tax=Arctium lappa TaxID=4217 RepID=A0ACB9BC88_ARCLA|nr:hypothetical protein L6452_20467 [Arctium lappa]